MTTPWPEVALGDVCDVLRGTTVTQAQTISGDVPVVAGGTGPTYFCNTANRDAGVVTISASGANAGYVNYWDEPIFASDCSTVESSDTSRTDIRFMFHQLKYLQPRFQASLRKGAAQPHVYAKDIAKISIGHPPIYEQRRIAAILDKADEVRSKRKAALETLETLSQAIFIEMFGDPVSNPMGWPTAQLADLVDDKEGIKCGPFGTQLSKSEYQHFGVPLWGIRHVNLGFSIQTSEYLTPLKAGALASYSLRPGDIVMTRKGTVGNCALYPADFQDGIMHSDLLRIRINDSAVPLFMVHQLQHSRDIAHQIRLISGGAVMPGINVGKLKALRVLVPPLKFQKAFTNMVRQEGVQFNSSLGASNLKEQLLASLQQKAFQGAL